MSEIKKAEELDNEALNEVTGGVQASAKAARGDLSRKLNKQTAQAVQTGKTRVEEMKGQRI